MKALIEIKHKNGIRVVSARELYDFLGLSSSQWSRWYNANIINDDLFEEGIDYQTLDIMSSSNNGSTTKDFALTIDMAKEISMLARTEKGKEARKYFIKCENQLKQVYSLPKSLPEALRALADAEEEKLLKEIELKQAKEVIDSQEPLVTFANSVKGSNNSILIRQFAKDLCDDEFKIGQNRLFEWFRNNRYINQNNEPYQNYVDQGLFEVITRSIGSGHETFTSKTTKITGKGQVYFTKKIKSLIQLSA